MLKFVNVSTESRFASLMLGLIAVLVVLGGSSTYAGEVTYHYDKSGRLKRVTYPDNKTKDYTLDPAGNRTQVQASAPTGGVLSFALGSYSVSEGVGSVQLSVTRTIATAGAVTVAYATASGSAVAGSDFTAKTGTLSWAAGDGAAKTITIQITNDSVFEVAEQLSINLLSPTGGAVIGSVSQSIISINDNDGGAFSVSPIVVNEAAGNASFVVTLSQASSVSHQVNYATAAGTAQPLADFINVTGTLTFAPGQTSQTVSVPVLNDTWWEGGETFTLTLSGATNGSTIATATAIATFADSSPPPVFSVNDVSAYEGSGSIAFLVTKTGSTAFAHAVNYTTVSGSATAGSDFVASSGTLTFSQPLGAQLITITLLDDVVYEGSETFTINLSNPTNGAVISDGQGIGTILDNEAPPPIPPSAPTGMAATVVSHSQVNLSWSAATAQAPKTVTSYQVYRNGSSLGQTSSLSFSDTGTAGSTTYNYTVAALDSGGYWSNQSTAVTVTTPAGPAAIPPTPTWTSFTNCLEPYGCELGGGFTVTWSATAGATYYELERDNDFGTTVVVQSINGLNYFQSEATRAFSNAYRVRACSSAGCSSYSPKIIFWMPIIIGCSGGGVEC